MFGAYHFHVAVHYALLNMYTFQQKSIEGYQKSIKGEV